MTQQDSSSKPTTPNTSANPTTVDDNCPPVSMSNVALGFIVALTDAIVLD